jgi:hypothetical protein
MKKCPNCHKLNPDEASFCTYCGTALKDKEKKEIVVSHTGSMAVVLIIACLVMLVLGCFLYPDHTDHVITGTYLNGTISLTADGDGTISFTRDNIVYTGSVSTDITEDEPLEIELADQQGETVILTLAFHDDSVQVFERTDNYQAVRYVLTLSA